MSLRRYMQDPAGQAMKKTVGANSTTGASAPSTEYQLNEHKNQQTLLKMQHDHESHLNLNNRIQGSLDAAASHSRNMQFAQMQNRFDTDRYNQQHGFDRERASWESKHALDQLNAQATNERLAAMQSSFNAKTNYESMQHQLRTTFRALDKMGEGVDVNWGADGGASFSKSRGQVTAAPEPPATKPATRKKTATA